MSARKTSSTARRSASKPPASVRDAFAAAQETVHARVGMARDQAEEAWENLESLFQSRVQKAMSQLGLPGADEFRELAKRVTEMRKELTTLARRTQPGLPARDRKRPSTRAKAKGSAVLRRRKTPRPRR